MSVAETADEAQAFLTGKPCGVEDWGIVKKQDADGIDVASIESRLAAKEKRIDPNLYPRLRGLTCLFKVKPENVENHILVKKALEGIDAGAIKLKAPDIAAYLLHNALK